MTDWVLCTLEQMKPLAKRMRLITVTKKTTSDGDVRFLRWPVDALDALDFTTTARAKLKIAIVLDFSGLLMHYN